jgi:hypothetical protein
MARQLQKGERCAAESPTGKLRCKLAAGHSEPHKDPKTEMRWNHPKKHPHMARIRRKTT